MVWIVLVVASAILGPILTPHDPYAIDIRLRNSPPGSVAPGQLPLLLGGDALGRDILSRLIVGARVSVTVGVLSVLISGLVGTGLGLVAGFYRGRVESVIMRFVDIQMSLPSLLVALFVLFVLGPSFLNVVFVLAVTRWMIYARIARGMSLSLRERAFVEAAKSLGATDRRLMLRHILPSMLGPMAALATLELPTVLLAEAALDFLGLGIQPPETSWGLMLAEGRTYLTSAWWLVTFPGLTLLLTALALNVLGVVATARAGHGASFIKRLES